MTLSANISISVFYLAVVFYAASLIVLPSPKKAWSIFFLCLGLAANLVSTIIRHLSIWPLLPIVIRHALKLGKKVFTIRKRENAELLFGASSRNLIYCKNELSILEKISVDRRFMKTVKKEILR